MGVWLIWMEEEWKKMDEMAEKLNYGRVEH